MEVKFYVPVIIVAICYLIFLIINFTINSFIDKIQNNDKLRNSIKKKQTTILKLIKNIVKYLMLVITILILLSVYGVDTKALLASLGIVGVILGLAMQDTIKNFLAGIKIIFDNNYMVGDYVTINNFNGEVIDLGLQTTKIKGENGNVLIINNVLITSIINHSLENHILKIELAVDKSVKYLNVEKIVNKVNNIVKENDYILSDINLKGIDTYNVSGNSTYLLEVCVLYNNKDLAKREINKLLKAEFDKLK